MTLECPSCFRQIKWRFTILLIVFYFVLLCLACSYKKPKVLILFFRFLIGVCYKYKNYIKTVHKFDIIFFQSALESTWKYLCLVETVITLDNTHTHHVYLVSHNNNWIEKIHFSSFFLCQWRNCCFSQCASTVLFQQFFENWQVFEFLFLLVFLRHVRK